MSANNSITIDPAMMTQKEYISALNPREKHHPDSAYDMTLEQMNEYFRPDRYRLVNRFRRNGLDFELLVNREKLNYTKHDQDGEIIRQNGNAVLYTDNEILDMGWGLWDYSFAITHDGKRVALADNEWGAWLFAVAKEYRGMGLGVLIGKIARSYHPDRESGGFSPSGLRNIRKIHSQYVRDAMANGRYTREIRSGKITPDRVREIINSIGARPIPTEQPNYNSSDPRDWLLYVDGYGTFILYDKKLLDVDDNNHFAEKMIKGAVYADVGSEYTRIRTFGADTAKLKTFMLSLAYSWARDHNSVLLVRPELYSIEGFEFGPEESYGVNSKEVLSGPTVPYHDFAVLEQRFRKTFDKYDEFRYRVHEMGEAKYD